MKSEQIFLSDPLKYTLGYTTYRNVKIVSAHYSTSKAEQSEINTIFNENKLNSKLYNFDLYASFKNIINAILTNYNYNTFKLVKYELLNKLEDSPPHTYIKIKNYLYLYMFIFDNSKTTISFIKDASKSFNLSKNKLDTYEYSINNKTSDIKFLLIHNDIVHKYNVINKNADKNKIIRVIIEI